MACPDFTDPNAEFVICTDACDIAVGAVLMQWQHPSGCGPGPPEGVPLRDGSKDALLQSWRQKSGWQLRTIAYYAKTLDTTQARYTVFDGVVQLSLMMTWNGLKRCNHTLLRHHPIVMMLSVILHQLFVRNKLLLCSNLLRMNPSHFLTNFIAV